MRYITKAEIDTAIKQTRQDLFKLESEIGRDAYFQIFDEYNPESDDVPPSNLLECLFGNAYDDKDCFMHWLAEDYIMQVWERTNKIAKTTKIPRKWTLQNEWRNFRKSILERDNYKCQECGTNKNLCVHHIKPRSEYKELVYDPSNVITLCKYCHAKRHPGRESLILGKGNQKKLFDGVTGDGE